MDLAGADTMEKVKRKVTTGKDNCAMQANCIGMHNLHVTAVHGLH